MPYIDASNRNPAVGAVARWFDFAHLDEPKRGISETIADTAQEMLDVIHLDSAELTKGLNKLLEAKDCFVRAVILQSEVEEVPVFDVDDD